MGNINAKNEAKWLALEAELDSADVSEQVFSSNEAPSSVIEERNPSFLQRLAKNKTLRAIGLVLGLGTAAGTVGNCKFDSSGIDPCTHLPCTDAGQPDAGDAGINPDAGDGGSDPDAGDGSTNPDAGDATVDEICDDNVDNNNNGQTDCEEASCDGEQCDPNNSTATCVLGNCQTPPEVCNNGIDDDGNNETDCEQASCLNQACGPTGDPSEASCNASGECQEKVCNDGMNNDSEDGADCGDPDCDGEVCDPNGDAVCISGTCTQVDCTIDSPGTNCADTACNNEPCDINGTGTAECIASQCRQVECADPANPDPDGDGLDRCDDGDCSNQDCDPTGNSGATCQAGYGCHETGAGCGDGVDNNPGNPVNGGFVDCADLGCLNLHTPCTASTLCVQFNSPVCPGSPGNFATTSIPCTIISSSTNPASCNGTSGMCSPDGHCAGHL